MLADRMVFVNGDFVKWQDATVHMMCHSFARGSAIFEGDQASTPRLPGRPSSGSTTIWRTSSGARPNSWRWSCPAIMRPCAGRWPTRSERTSSRGA